MPQKESRPCRKASVRYHAGFGAGHAGYDLRSLELGLPPAGLFLRHDWLFRWVSSLSAPAASQLPSFPSAVDTTCAKTSREILPGRFLLALTRCSTNVIIALYKTSDMCFKQKEHSWRQEAERCGGMAHWHSNSLRN